MQGWRDGMTIHSKRSSRNYLFAHTHYVGDYKVEDVRLLLKAVT